MSLLDSRKVQVAGLVVCGLFFAGRVVHALKNGYISPRNERVDRHDNPIIFYFLILFLMAISGVSFVAAYAVSYGKRVPI